ncbi:lectin-like protein [Herrania umbratica]|uniref:Lectin-like protein n=1 Tax=Herrania umbratica TaxID=108875 RepID=A0A6J1BG43_9ROSI|nr:lectin-like protein [Herrania umbratica]
MALTLHTSPSMALQPWNQPVSLSISPDKNNLPAHGLDFIFVTCTGIQYLGFLNRSKDGNLNNHAFGIEFDEFNDDINNDNDVAVDMNSVTSLGLRMNNGAKQRVWNDYIKSRLSVTMAPASKEKPRKPLINVAPHLSHVLLQEMYVGFKFLHNRMPLLRGLS